MVKNFTKTLFVFKSLNLSLSFVSAYVVPCLLVYCLQYYSYINAKHAMCNRSNKIKAMIIPGRGGEKEGIGHMVYKTVPERSEEQTEIVNIGWLYFRIVRLNPVCTFTSCLRKHKTNMNNKVLIFWGGKFVLIFFSFLL